MNGFSDSGASALAEALKVNDVLATLDLTNNRIGMNGATAIAGALEINRDLETLEVGNSNSTFMHFVITLH